MKKVSCIIITICLICSFFCPVAASRADTEDITGQTAFSGTGYSTFSFLKDKDTDVYKQSSGNTTITLTNEQGMACIYLLFDLEYGAYTVYNSERGARISAGKYGMLHEYIDLTAAYGEKPTSVTLEFASGSVCLSEIYVFSGTDVPAFVQKWAPPLEQGADILLFPSHGDDDQLYFAGLMPLYAKEKAYRVQVVYLTDHRNLTHARTHEMLNGLWNVGITAYPVFGHFADFRIDDLEETLNTYQNTYGTTEEELQGFVVEQIRRFKPLVAIGHDLNGEYGHGMHQLYAYLLTKAISLSGDPESYPDSAQQYGTWTFQKLYLHSYAQNPIVLDYDEPLASFSGMTAFEVTQKLGFPCHVSQQWTGFVSWLYGYNQEITKATQIQNYSPCKFGLYYTSVGEDIQKNDFMENIVSYAEQARLEEEEGWEEEPLLPGDTTRVPTQEPTKTPGSPVKPSRNLLPFVLLLVLLVLFVLAVSVKLFNKRRRFF